MNTYTISELYGGAYDAAIDNVIAVVNKLGWNWNPDYLRNDAHAYANDAGFRFDVNGNFAN